MNGLWWLACKDDGGEVDESEDKLRKWFTMSDDRPKLDNDWDDDDNRGGNDGPSQIVNILFNNGFMHWFDRWLLLSFIKRFNKDPMIKKNNN